MDATAGNSNRIEWNGPHAHGCSCSPNFSRHMDSWSISSMSAGWWIRGAPNKNILNPYLATWPLGERGIHVGNCHKYHKSTVWEWFIQFSGDFGDGSHWLSSIHPGAFFHPVSSSHVFPSRLGTVSKTTWETKCGWTGCSSLATSFHGAPTQVLTQDDPRWPKNYEKMQCWTLVDRFLRLQTR